MHSGNNLALTGGEGRLQPSMLSQADPGIEKAAFKAAGYSFFAKSLTKQYICTNEIEKTYPGGVQSRDQPGLTQR